MKRSQTICIVNSQIGHREVRPDTAFSRRQDGVVCEQVGGSWVADLPVGASSTQRQSFGPELSVEAC